MELTKPITAGAESGNHPLDDSSCRGLALGEASLLNLGRVASTPLHWVWEGFIPRGKLTLLTGEPGVGKSLFALQVVSTVTRGLPAPFLASRPDESGVSDESTSTSSSPGAVVLFSADDCLTDTIRPRLEASKADLSRVYMLSSDRGETVAESADFAGGRDAQARTFQLDRDLPNLEMNLRRLRDDGVDVRLIVIDPIDCCMNAADKNVDLTGIVARLVALASWSGAAVLVVANSTSSGIGRAGYRSGTIGNPELANAARSVLMIAQDLETEDRRLVLPVKMNLCGNRPGVSFSILDGNVEWSADPIPLTGEEYFTQAKEKLRNPLVREECSEVTRVTNWLRERLSQGRVSSVIVRMDACENEIAYTTLRRAFRRLGCRAFKPLGVGRWYWRLPGCDPVSSVAENEGTEGIEP